MCGRYTLRRINMTMKGAKELPETKGEFSEKVNLFNIAPSHKPPIIRLDAKGERTIGPVKWGLIPHWTKGKPKTMPINARSETAATSGMFKQALDRRRALVPADGFYEWQGAKPPKQPYFIHLIDDAVFAFAGIWERWDGEQGPEDTFAILTTEPNALMARIHNRMPVILDEADYDRWLDRNVPAGDVMDLLKPYDAAKMEAYPVSSKVNTPRNQGPELVERVG